MEESIAAGFREGGFALLAIVAMVMLNAVWKQYANSLVGDRSELLKVLMANAAALSELRTVVAELSATLRGVPDPRAGRSHS